MDGDLKIPPLAQMSAPDWNKPSPVTPQSEATRSLYLTSLLFQIPIPITFDIGLWATRSQDSRFPKQCKAIITSRLWSIRTETA